MEPSDARLHHGQDALGSCSAGVACDVLLDLVHGVASNGQGEVVATGAGVGGQLVELMAHRLFAATQQVHPQVAGQRQRPQPRVLVAHIGAQVLGGVPGLAVATAAATAAWSWKTWTRSTTR